MNTFVKLLGLSACGFVLTTAVANAESVALSDGELDRVVAGFTAFPPLGSVDTSPPPLLPPPAGSENFDINVGLLKQPPPPPAPPPPAPPPPPGAETPTTPGTPSLRDLRAIIQAAVRAQVPNVR